MRYPIVRILGMDKSGKTVVCQSLETLCSELITFESTPRYAYRWLKTYGIGKADEVTLDQVDIRRHVFLKTNEYEAYTHRGLAAERPVVAVRGRADTWISASALKGEPMPKDFGVLFPKELRPDLLVVLTAPIETIEARLDQRNEKKTGANSMEYHRRTQAMYDDLAKIAGKHIPVLSYDTGRSTLSPQDIADEILETMLTLQASSPRITPRH